MAEAKRPERKPNPEMFKAKEPAQLFDDLYLTGSHGTGILILRTSEGLVFLDASGDVDAYDKYIEPFYEKFGFRDEKVLMIILTHAHFDHYLGSEMIRRKTGCEVALSWDDTAYITYCRENIGPDGEYKMGVYPRITRILHDGEELVFGDHTIRIMVGGGHTPGCLNLLFDVHEGDKTYHVVECGGFGIFGPGRFPDGDYIYGKLWAVEQALNYANSSVKLWEYCKQHNVTVFFNPHPHLCDAWKHVEENKERKEGDENAFSIGLEGVRKYIVGRYTAALESASAFSGIEEEYDPSKG